jgi:hypothetical protein
VIGYSRREERPPLLFVSWGAIAGRSAEIAASLGGQARTYFAPGPYRRPPVLLRYLLASMLTGATLIARRPRVVVVTNPPVPAALVTWFWARLVGAVLEAARLVPEIDLLLTGDPNVCADALRRDAPGNVTFVGFLGPADYHEAVVDADAVLTLTTEPASVMRAAYEAVYARRPLVLSDWPASRALFPAAVHVLHTPEALAEGLSRLAADYPSFQASAESARRSQLARWTEQHGELVRRLRALAPAPDPPG